MARFSKIAAAPAFAHPKAGLVVMVGPDIVAAALIETFGRLHLHEPPSEKLLVASTLEEAYEIIAQRQGTK